MADRIPPKKSVSRQKATSLLALVLLLAVFGVVLFSVSNRLRTDMRQRVLEREASAMMPLVQYEVDRVINSGENGVLGTEASLMVALLETSNIEGTLGVQLFDRLGESLFSVPESVEVDRIDSEDLGLLYLGNPVSVFWRDAYENPSFDQFLDNSSQHDPLYILEVLIPLSGGSSDGVVGIGRYVLDGDKTEKVLEGIDSDVARLSLFAFCSGGGLISFIFLLSVSRLRKAYTALDVHVQRLEQANSELDSVARTAAIGAVASHLVHGLKNPLAGLRQYVEASDVELDDEDRRDALEAGQRMQTLISEVVDVIRGNVSEESIQVDFDDLKSVLERKHHKTALGRKIGFEVIVEGEAELDSRSANIALLIVSNLVQNALDASAEGGLVEVRIRGSVDTVLVSVRDSGSGFSKAARDALFSPVQSMKADGTGIGLVISSQLAKHIGAEIRLAESSEMGSLVELAVPIVGKVMTSNLPT